MFRRLTGLFMCLAIFSTIGKAEEQTDNRKLASQIVTNLFKLIDSGQLERRDLTIEAYGGNVTVTGRIEDRKEARLILESIITSTDVRGLQLNLGIGRQPSPRYTSAVSSSLNADLRRPLRWDDGDWNLDFVDKPRNKAMRAE